MKCWTAHGSSGRPAAALKGSCGGVGALDPACGSGTLLHHAALRILDAPAVRALSPVQQASVAARLVHGVDIHPVAVEVARVNVLRALRRRPRTGRRRCAC